MYEEMMNDDNLESNLLTYSLLKMHSLYKFCRVQVAHVELDICVEVRGDWRVTAIYTIAIIVLLAITVYPEA